MLAVLIDRGGNSGLRFLSACAERNLRSEFPWERKFAYIVVLVGIHKIRAYSSAGRAFD